MEGSTSTTLVVVGDEAPAAIRSLTRFANVRAASFHDVPDASDSDVARWSAHSTEPYVVHDLDPLGHVASAWVEFFEEQVTLGVLELEIDRAIEAAGRHLIAVPDYYVVIHPETLPTTWRHWWLGVIAAASPTRVIPWPAPDRSDDDSFARLLRKLPTGRAWPEVETWLPNVVRQVPDRVGLDGRVDRAS
ncbi:hypothetical protein [Agromyces aerolatus]|uniref:hypothetical protein n=1 Tax=Agromyces sp. LY-1074 TaxID=3074080 RepID=UPI0028545225|nr:MULTISPECIES: hypothetical protein [unclassified Agromyces]MDR5699678.1 hypothetical protein [Agromyces sp. LY-1074]MDR5705974.1 hypothetical protein [Agromyces sp. LY-1358]